MVATPQGAQTEDAVVGEPADHHARAPLDEWEEYDDWARKRVRRSSAPAVIHAPRADALRASHADTAVQTALARRAFTSDPSPFDEALQAGLVALCNDRADVLAHAVRATDARSPLRPLGVLCGEEAANYALLGNALFGLSPPGTGLTRAAIRDREPVWMPSLPDSPQFVRRDLLARFGVRSGAAFPVSVGSKIVAVIELLCFREFSRATAPPATVATVTAELHNAARSAFAR